MRLRNIPGARETIANSPLVISQGEENKGRWHETFGNNNPLHIEVGMGKGRFIMAMAELHPEINYIGIEMYDSVLLRALQKMEEKQKQGEVLLNLRFMRMDARNLMQVFEKGEIGHIYLNFSDPWPKSRYAKRRLTSHQFLERYDAVLSQNGVVEFKTDNQQLFDFSLEEVKQANWKLLACTYDLHHDEKMGQENVMTEYEEKFSKAGNPICKMVISR